MKKIVIKILDWKMDIYDKNINSDKMKIYKCLQLVEWTINNYCNCWNKL